MSKRYFSILLALLTILSCCKRDDVKHSQTSSSLFTETSYPIAIGDWWQYQVNQTNEGGAYDTISLNVLYVTNCSPYIKYMCSVVLNGAVIDSGYFLQSDTSLSFTNILPTPYFSLFPNFHIKFPVETGQYWPGAFPGDSILVAGVTASCQGGNGNLFDSCFITVEKYNLPHNFKVEDMYLSPKIGLVYQWVDFNSDTAEGGVQINQSITLLNYHVQ